jgi:hypothetical protein
MAAPSVTELREMFAYDSLTGVLTTVERPRHMFATDRACRYWNSRFAGSYGHVDKTTGYVRFSVNGRHYYAHRIIAALMNGAWPSENAEIDHINGVRTANMWSNLRVIDGAKNKLNAKKRVDNSSGVTGVHWCDTKRKWTAQIQFEGKYRFLGRFDSMNEAIACRKAAEKDFGFHVNHGRAA